MYDIIVVGGGPAGMTAALYAKRNNKNVLIIEKDSFGGQANYSPRIENYPGIVSISGMELGQNMFNQLLELDVDFRVDTVLRIEKQEHWFTVMAEEEQFQSTAVILATGVKHRMLGVDGEYELIGNGLSFCAICDGEFYRDQEVAVIGGGNSALQEAIQLSNLCKKVTIIQNLGLMTAEPQLIDQANSRENIEVLYNTTVVGFNIEDGKFTGLRLQGAANELNCDGAFIAIGLSPNNEMFKNLVILDNKGYFFAKDNCTTSNPGVFCAGDCRSKDIRQLTTAVADGAMAAIAACNYIDKEASTL